ncbi:MAG: ATP-binding protein [Anaeromyxobacter sp.]
MTARAIARLLALAITAHAGAALASGAPAPGAPPQILVVHSYHRGFTWTDQENDGIFQVLRARWPGYVPSVFYLDSKHFRGPAQERAALGLLAARRPPEPWAAILATDDAALDFVLAHRAELGGETAAIAFCGVNDAGHASGAPRVSGVLEDVDVAGTLALARVLQPDLRRLVVVLDQTETSQAIGPRLRGDPALAGSGLTVQYAQGLSMAEVEALARGLGPGDALLLASFVTDRLGAVHSYEEVAERVSTVSRAPVYGLWEFQLGHGIVGGSLLSGSLQGRRAAELALALLDGGPARIEGSSGVRRAVDVAAAERAGLDVSRIAAGTALVNAPETLWSTHRAEVIAAATAFVVLLAFAAVLLAVNRRLVLARRELRGEIEERERLRIRLEETQRLEAVGRLAGGIAHDLNNLLTPILVCARLVKDGLPAADPAREDLETITRAAERARALTAQVLAFSRRQRLELKVLDLNEVVRGFHELLPRLIGEDVKVRVSTAPGRLRVRGDAGQLQQVLMNLAVNARDAMPGGGVLELSTAARADGAAVLSVRDSGVGMDAALQARAFEPFFTTKPVGKGTGLGLSTCHGIVKQHGGEIELESAPGRGTTFRITLPGAAEEPEAPAAATAPAAAAAARAPGAGTILLVEDEPLVRQLATRVLSAAGYAVVEAENGPGALALARRLEGIDLLLTDVVMPGIGGRELRDRIVAEHPGVPVLFMSGYPALPGSDEPLGFAPNEVILPKPFTGEELLAKVAQTLGRAAAPAA